MEDRLKLATLVGCVSAEAKWNTNIPIDERINLLQMVIDTLDDEPNTVQAMWIEELEGVVANLKTEQLCTY